jgi:hypothetical protein
MPEQGGSAPNGATSRDGDDSNAPTAPPAQ